MKAVWVTRSFLDYRIPVYEEVSKRFDGRFVLIFNADYVPDRCCMKAEKALECRARGLRGEFALRFGRGSGFANEGVRIPFQRGLVKTILEETPDVLISDGFFQWTYSALWLRATRGIPHVMCYERTAHTERNAQWYRIAYRKVVIRWIDAMCCNGRLCSEYVQKLGFPVARLTLGHMVADVKGLLYSLEQVSEEQTTQIKFDFGLKGTVLLYVGQLIPRKGILQLLEAWKQVHETMPPDSCSLLLVGDGQQRDQCENFCGSHALRNVRFVGSVDYDSLPPYYKVADAFVVPTLEDNWSLVVPEAMACGLPILCSKYNACWPELIQRDNGWVFDPLDIKSTIDVLRKCLDAEGCLTKMGQASTRIIQCHTATQAAEAVLKACQLAVQRRRAI